MFVLCFKEREVEVVVYKRKKVKLYPTENDRRAIEKQQVKKMVW